MLKARLPDGNLLELEPSRNLRPIDVARKIGPRLARDTIAAEVDGQLVGADYILPDEGEVGLRLLTSKDPQSLDVLRHSCAHVMARAVMRLYPGSQLAFGLRQTGRFDRAIAIARDATALAERLYGADSRSSLKPLGILADALGDIGYTLDSRSLPPTTVIVNWMQELNRK